MFLPLTLFNLDTSKVFPCKRVRNNESLQDYETEMCWIATIVMFPRCKTMFCHWGRTAGDLTTYFENPEVEKDKVQDASIEVFHWTSRREDLFVVCIQWQMFQFVGWEIHLESDYWKNPASFCLLHCVSWLPLTRGQASWCCYKHFRFKLFFLVLLLPFPFSRLVHARSHKLRLRETLILSQPRKTN